MNPLYSNDTKLKKNVNENYLCKCFRKGRKYIT